jgi:DNA polymerase-4
MLNGSVNNPHAVIMYIDMNSFFASCEQQENKELRGKPIGVITHPSEYACVIAPSTEAKKHGIKTGMRLPECKVLCPEMIPVVARPYIYRHYHIDILNVLNFYCDDVKAKSIDEAVMNFTSYKLVYKDFKKLAQNIKDDLAGMCGDYVKCSIGIAPNSFLAKLATEIKAVKQDGILEITPENLDFYLGTLKLTDLPGIARANASRLERIGIRTPLQMRHSSESLLRKAFGGVVGNYWYRRLHFQEVDMYENGYKAMSATRMVSRDQRQDRQAMESLLISLCTRLEQRMVKQKVFCRAINFYIGYKDLPSWETNIKFSQPLQDAVEMRRYIEQKMHVFEQSRGYTLLNNKVDRLGVVISNFIKSRHVEYGLFDNKMKQDTARVTMYNIKDKYGRDIVRKASETVRAYEMRDAIGFGSVKDFQIQVPDNKIDEPTEVNQYLLQDDRPRQVPKHVLALRERKAKALAVWQQNTTNHNI